MRVAFLLLGLITAAGSVRGDEEKIDVKSLPKAVLAAVKAKFPAGKLTGAAKEEKGRKVTYEVALENEGHTRSASPISTKGEDPRDRGKSIDKKNLPRPVAAAARPSILTLDQEGRRSSK